VNGDKMENEKKGENRRKRTRVKKKEGEEEAKRGEASPNSHVCLHHRSDKK